VYIRINVTEATVTIISVTVHYGIFINV